MAQVLGEGRETARVIGDGEWVPDGEVDGLTEADLVALYRDLVLLRTYDERSVVYHRQGRIGTYAIFWDHEAMQAGSAYALATTTGSSPPTASRRSASCAACRPRPSSRGGEAIPAGWWNPADYNVASICVPIATHVPHAVGLAWGKRLRGEHAVAIAYFGDGATSRARSTKARTSPRSCARR